MNFQGIVNIVFYSLMGIVGLVSIAAVYALLRFGKSKILGLSVSIIYVLLMWGLFISAVVSLNKIPFDNFSL